MSKPTIYQLIKKPSSKLIDELAKDEIVIVRNRDCSYSYIHQEICNNRNEGFRNMLNAIANQKAEMLADYEYVKALKLFYDRNADWIRDIKTWKKKSRSRDRQFKEIANHLFVKYEMPNFMYSAWFWTGNTLNLAPIQWFIDIGKGMNIRKSSNLPFPLTKKMAHNFMKAPDGFTPNEAFRYAQIIDMGGDMRTIKGVMSSKLGNDFKNNDFWNSVIRFFINNPMLDAAQYNPIVDYIHYMKFQNRTAIIEGVRTLLPPEKPNFSMKDRDPETLVAHVERWHNQMAKGSRKGVPQKWEPMLVNDFVHTTGKDDNKMTYTITQLTTSAELRSEGRAMKHCVSSYTNSCANGRCAIFSLAVNSKTQLDQRMVTIEVSKECSINQIRGKGNRLPVPHEMKIINMWAYRENLGVSKWIKN